MKGNLSKKKGFLGELDEEDLENIAESLEGKFDERLGAAETDIVGVNAVLEKKEDKENKLSKDKFFEAIQTLSGEELEKLYVSALAIAEIVTRLGTVESKADNVIDDMVKFDGMLAEKEDISNKTQTISDNPSTEKYPSEAAVLKLFIALGQSISADYYTKTEIDAKNSEIQDTANFALGEVTNFRYDLDLKENVSNKITDLYAPDIPDEAYPTANAMISYVIDHGNSTTQMANAAIKLADELANQVGDQETGLDTKESLSNKVTDFEVNIDNEKYPTTGAVFELVNTFSNSTRSWVTDMLEAEYYTKTEIDATIGDISSALDNIIALQAQY